MKVLIASGIWPPDVGGPASHSPELAAALASRGHAVEVLTTANTEPSAAGFPIHWVGRRLPPGPRHAVFAARLAARARRADVVYVNSVLTRGVLGSRLAGTPVVVKLTDDPAFERARRLGLFGGDLDAFQSAAGGVRVAALRSLRDAALARATLVLCPSAYLRRHALGWGLDPARVEVVPNAIPGLPALPTRADARRELGVGDGPLYAFAGRLGAAKSLTTLFEAMRILGRGTLVLAGDGPDRRELEADAARLGDRVRFLGSVGRERVLRLFRAADLSVLSSEWENFPHTLVEALAVGTPVVATSVGGIPEIVQDGSNGLLVPPGDPAALADALRSAFERREQLAAAAAPSVEHLRPERVYAGLEELLVRVASRP